MKNKVIVEACETYEPQTIDVALSSFDCLFKQIIPGDTVVIKPNWIAERHKFKKEVWEPVITHPNVILGIIRKVIQRLEGSGKIIIADGPVENASFEALSRIYNFENWKNIGRKAGIEIEILDLRKFMCINENDIIVDVIDLPGDPQGDVDFDLKEASEFIGHSPSSKGYYGASYDSMETNAAHSNGKHLYRVSKSVISADVFINVPKLKVHKKAGITCSLKNLVGINTYKNFLPHHNEGVPSIGGDQFPGSEMKNRLEGLLLSYFKKIQIDSQKFSSVFIRVKKIGRLIFGETTDTIRSGNWYGNDTLWRTILDLNKLLLYGDDNGDMKMVKFEKTKKYISIVDGIVGGQGNGPEAPDSFVSKMLIAGENPVSVDCVCAKLMGFDYKKIPALKNAFKIKNDHYPLLNFDYNDIVVKSDSLSKFCKTLKSIEKRYCYQFTPHFGWKRFIELE